MDNYNQGYVQGREDAAKELIKKMEEFDMINGFASVLVGIVRGKNES